jgi:hypothetical protein
MSMSIDERIHVYFSLIDDVQHHPTLPLSFDMTTFEDVSLYSCTQYDLMKTADEILSSMTFADCTIDPSRVTLHESLLEGILIVSCSLLASNELMLVSTRKGMRSSMIVILS